MGSTSPTAGTPFHIAYVNMQGTPVQPPLPDELLVEVKGSVQSMFISCLERHKNTNGCRSNGYLNDGLMKKENSITVSLILFGISFLNSFFLVTIAIFI